jgi:hypothetical protein
MASEEAPVVDIGTARERANIDTRRAVGTLRFIISVALLDIAAAAGAFIAAVELESGGWLYPLAVIGAAGVGTLAAISGAWVFQFVRAPVRQRDEARAALEELTKPSEFPNISIEIGNFRQSWEDHAGAQRFDHGTHRVRFPVVVTNRETSRPVSLSFSVTINSPDGNVLATMLPTEQEDELPLVVRPQDSTRIELSVFLNEFVTERLRTTERVRGRLRVDINGDLFRLNVFDLLSQKGIEMWLPGFYPWEDPPVAPE